MKRRLTLKAVAQILLPVAGVTLGIVAASAQSPEGDPRSEPRSSPAAQQRSHYDSDLARTNAQRDERSVSPFDRLDRDGDGVLTRGEVEGHDRVEGLWKDLDTSGDGRISRGEFMADHRGMRSARGPGSGAEASGTGSAAGIWSDDLLGMRVRGRDGGSLGEVRDVVIDVESGRVEYAVIGSGGHALYALPVSAFSYSRDGQGLVLSMDDEQLQSAQGFNQDSWPRLNERNQADGRRWQASRLVGRDVTDRNGAHLGEIEDLLINPRTAQVDAVVLQYDRPWTLDNPLVTVTLPSLDFGDGNRNVSLDVDRNQIDAQLTRYSRQASSRVPDYNVVVEHWIVLVPQQAVAANTRPNGGSSGAANAEPGSSTEAPTGARSPGSQKSASRSVESGAVGMARTNAAFDRLDRNRDGKLTRQEYYAAPAVQEGFGRLDEDGSEALSRSEFREAESDPGRSSGDTPRSVRPVVQGDEPRVSEASTTQGRAMGSSRGTESQRAKDQGSSPGPEWSRGATSSVYTSETFDRLDTDNDGQLTRDELEQDSALASRWHVIDADHNGTVTGQEFTGDRRARAARD